MSFRPDPALINDSTEGCPPYSLPSDLDGRRIYHAPDGTCAPVSLSGRSVDKAPWYGYNPELATGIVFLILYSLPFFAHIALWLISRRWWLVVLPIFAMGECIGWAGRVISGHRNDYSTLSYNAFLVQICCLTISPAFASATAYGVYTLLVHHINPVASRFRPRTLVYVFVGWDIFSLILQSAGGGTASNAKTDSAQKRGTNIFVAGIAFQLFATAVFWLLTVEYLVKIRRTTEWAQTTSGVRRLYYGNLVASLLIIARGAYRTVELAQGWRGEAITHEGYFIAFDAVPMLLVLLIYLMVHPVFTLPKHTAPLNHSPNSLEKTETKPAP